MRTLLRLAAAVSMAPLPMIASTAFAAPSPLVEPASDVDVTYRVPVPAASGTALLQRLRWSASLRRQRVDLPTSGNWMVVDFAARRMSLVQDRSRQVVDLPAPKLPEPSGGHYAKGGRMTVAGLACTQWQTTDTRGIETLACYTDDGVLLRASAGTRILMEAVSVQHVRQDDAVFAVPGSYSHQTTP